MSAGNQDAVLLCPAGFEQVVARVAASELLSFSVSAIGGGYVRGTTAATATQLRAFPVATNAFFVVASAPATRTATEMRSLAQRIAHIERPAGLPRDATFRLRIHNRGRFITTSTTEARNLEAAFAACTGLRPSRSSAQLEVWLIRRDDQPDVVLATKLTAGVGDVPAGVLRPEIAAALARIDRLAGRRVLDPFAGSGAIGVACLEAGAASVWLNDIATDAPVPGADVTRQDFRDLAVAPGAIDVVVTDPPWGDYEPPSEGIPTLYRDFGGAVATWLSPDGALVALTGADDEAIDVLLAAGELDLVERLPVLVNGHKAAVIHARPRP